MMTISSQEVADAAGISYRMLDYWARIGVIPPEYVAHRRHGSGYGRKWSPDVLAPLKVLGRVVQAFPAPTRPSRDIMRAIFEMHDQGSVDLGGGVSITWTVDR